MKIQNQVPKTKREQKKEINVKWNSPLFFQIGVIVSLLVVFFIIETPFEKEKPIPYIDTSINLEEPPMIDYVIEFDVPVKTVKKSEVKPTPKLEPKKQVISNELKVIKNLNPDIESDILSNDVLVDIPIPSKQPAAPEGDNSEPKSIINVEHVPVYPGCETLGSNAEKIDCMSNKINSFINKNFRKELLENFERNDIQKIYVQFKINSQGYITDVRANSNNERLKIEAQRVVSKLPEMKPGKQGDKNVDVLYTLPIIFKAL